jgi:hemolysin activation/secretion protein
MERAPDVRLPRVTEAAPAAEDAAPDLPCFPIRNVVLAGDGAARFAFALAALPDRSQATEQGACLGARGINGLLQQVQNAIVARGFVSTRVLAAPQDLKTGTLALTVVAGRIRSIRIEDDGTHRGTAWNAAPARPGDLLDLRDIEQGLENLKRVPSAEADIQIEPAERPGESDLVIRWKQGFPFRASLSIDDAGSKGTGRYQGSATVAYDHALTLNDLLYLTLNHDLGGGDAGERGTQGHTVHYSVPLGYWLLGITASSNTYHQAVAGASQTYRYGGDSRNTDIRLSRLVYRDAVRKTTLSLRGWARSSKNFIDDTEVEVQRRRMAGWELGVSHREFIGAATLDASAAWRRGTGAHQSLRAPEEAFGEGTSRARVLSADAQLSLPFTIAAQRLRYSGGWRAQWNRTPLVPQDRFSIGNRYTVRGFDGEVTLSAERGGLLRNDLGWSLANTGAELYVGVDHGRVGGPAARQLVGRGLTGGVVGMRGAWQALGYDLFVGWPIEKPDGFRASRATAGFSLNFAF